MCRIFSQEVYNYLYSDINFVKFLNTLYSSYDLSINNVKVFLDNEENIVDFNIYLRLFLANIEPFIEFLDKLDKELSKKNRRITKEYIGTIKGHLNISRYIVNKVSGKYPRTYPCIVSEKSFLTQENLYILFYSTIIKEKLRYIIEFINSVPSKKRYLIKEKSLSLEYYYKLDEFINAPHFKEATKEIIYLRKRYGSKLPLEYYEIITSRLKKGKIGNIEAYNETIEWIRAFENKDKISEKGNGKILRYDNKDFCDKLFEIWILYKIKETLIEFYGYELINENPIICGRNDAIFHLINNQDINIYIYFQKGRQLYWEESSDRNWAYVGKRETYLKGIPDITIKKESDYSELVMIDAKNKIREQGNNSEEIYKIIGYYDNFENSISSDTIFNKSFIIFRNDLLSFSESLVDKNGRKIINYSVGLIENEILNDNQFFKLCGEILS